MRNIMKNGQLKRFSIIALAVLVLAAVGGEVLARSLTDLNRQRQELRDGQAELRALIAQAQAEYNDIDAELLTIELELMEAEAAYLIALENLAYTQNLLNETEARLYLAEIEREIRFEVLRGRLRFMHENNNLSYIELLLSSQNITEFMNNREHFRRIIEHDNNMVSELAALENQIAADRDAIVETKLAIEAYAAELEITMDNLEQTMMARWARLDEIASTQEGYQAMLRQMEESDRRITMEIAAAEAAAVRARAPVVASVNIQEGAAMAWPVALAPHVNSPFGNRPNPFNRRVTEFHRGIDLRAPMRTPILAAEDGRVTFVGWRSGYGNTIIIDHGNGITTLYAHNTQNQVSVGQYVTRGQQIALAGSTGWSTGPHLHFEVRINGTAVDPAPFLGIR
jgi:murein DD-endopeptidase MepM/ murein hydrolase activator NlpD